MSVSLGLGTGCGPKVPTHGGEKGKPWKKAKPIKLDEQFLGTSKGELDYADFKRSKWLTLEVPAGDLTLDLEFTPTDDAGDATVAMEVLDANYKVISEDEDAPLVAVEREDDDHEDEDADEDEDEEEEEEEEEENDSGGDTQKTRSLPGLSAGTYYVHLFLTKRMDAAEYKVAVKFEPVIEAPKSTFPKDVAWVPALPIVPFDDDAPAPAPPKDDKDKGKGKGKGKGKTKDKDDKEPADPEPVSTGSVNAQIIDVKTSGDGTGADIMINAGTDQGLDKGRKGSISGVKKGGSFTLASCTARTCKASVSASVDDVNRSKKSVTIK